MAHINSITIYPPLINTACAWASEFDQLKNLYDCPNTGAVTTRTTTTAGFHQNSSHTVAFSNSSVSSLNSYGYSPHPLPTYLAWIEKIMHRPPPASSPYKPFIISITASSSTELSEMIIPIQALRERLQDGQGGSSRIAIEFNTSCPNVGGSPQGYVMDIDETMMDILAALATEVKKDETLTVGLKLPPYIYREQFVKVLEVMKGFGIRDDASKKNAFAFFTCTNTLGCSLLYPDQVVNPSEDASFAIPTVLGGLGGEGLHALALGNVYTFRTLLQKEEDDEAGLKAIVIIGAGGVTSREAASRMKKAGAAVVGCATILGLEGLKAFELLSQEY